MLQLFNVLQSSLTTFNNTISSLPFFIRYFVHAILAFCLPFYSVYHGITMVINRIYRISYPFYRLITLIARLLTFFITLPLRIITYVTTQTQALLINLIKLLIIMAIIIGILVVFLNENQLNYIKSYVTNTTDLILKQASMVWFIRTLLSHLHKTRLIHIYE